MVSKLQIKTDVETQGDFIRFLIKEVEDATFTDIEDVVPFVKWLDDELSYLVHFSFLFWMNCYFVVFDGLLMLFCF